MELPSQVQEMNTSFTAAATAPQALSDARAEDDLTRLVRTGLHSLDMKERLNVAANKLAGRTPLGITASSKAARKLIGGAGELLALLKYSLSGIAMVLLGAAGLFTGISGTRDRTVLAGGLGAFILGVVALRRAYRASRNLRSISKA